MRHSWKLLPLEPPEEDSASGSAGSMSSESEELPEPRREAAKVSGWRRLPTALPHLLLVECIHVYLAVFAWLRLITNVNLRTAMRQHFANSARLESYFSHLFLYGSVQATTVQMSNVTDPFFLGHNETLLRLPATSIDGANLPWSILIWVLPVGAGLLVLFILVSFVGQGIWSFESAAYLQFTWDIVRRPKYRCCVAVMASAAVLLPLLWVAQIIMYRLEDQVEVLRASMLSGLLLLFALNQLAFPSVPAHDWHHSSFQTLLFRRPLLHLFLGTNKSFGLKLVDALWRAEHGDASKLCRYLPDAGDADAVLTICREVQHSENEHRSRPHSDSSQLHD